MCSSGPRNCSESVERLKIITLFSEDYTMSDFHVVCANLIERNNEFLLVQEGKESVRGQWNLPAGGVKEHEDLKETAVREASEEAGLNVELEGLIGVFTDESDTNDATVIVFVFSANAEDFDIEFDGEEIIDAEFFSPEEFKEMDIRVPFLKEAVERYSEGEIKDLNTLKDYR